MIRFKDCDFHSKIYSEIEYVFFSSTIIFWRDGFIYLMELVDNLRPKCFINISNIISIHSKEQQIKTINHEFNV